MMNNCTAKINSTGLMPIILWIMVIMLFSGCASSPEIKPQIAKPSLHKPVVEYALTLQGIPYRYGKSSPSEGFDCSGLVHHVYRQYGVNLPRTAHEMASALPSVPRYNISSGDLIFFNTSGRPYSHVGIYIGEGKFIHAPSRRTGRVLVSNLQTPYWQKHFCGIRRP